MSNYLYFFFIDGETKAGKLSDSQKAVVLESTYVFKSLKEALYQFTILPFTSYYKGFSWSYSSTTGICSVSYTSYSRAVSFYIVFWHSSYQSHFENDTYIELLGAFYSS